MGNGNAVKKRIFLVEDDLELAGLILSRLKTEAFEVIHESNGEAAVKGILRENPDLVVLDIMLPGMDGFSVCRNIRPQFKGPVLILTARDSDVDQILGFELGADDFVIKPIRPMVLVARIRALLRRAHQKTDPSDAITITTGDLVVDSGRREAWLKGVLVDLTTVEFDLMWFLVNNEGKVVSRNDIHLALYNSEYDGIDRSIDVYISRIRQKLGDSPTKPSFLKTVRGIGYLFAGNKK